MSFVKVNLQRDGVSNARKERFACFLVEDGYDGATFDPHGLLVRTELDVVVPEAFISIGDLDALLVAVPFIVEWQVVVDQCNAELVLDKRWPFKFRRDQECVSKHELSVHIVGGLQIRELIPHGAKDWLSSLGVIVEHSVIIPDDVVTHLDGLANGLEHAR